MRQKKQHNLQLLDILACNSANRVIKQNIQKLLIFGVFASYIARILKVTLSLESYMYFKCLARVLKIMLPLGKCIHVQYSTALQTI